MIFCWDNQGGLIHTGILESNPLDAYHEVGHLDWDLKEPNVLHCIDTDNEGEDQESDNGTRSINRAAKQIDSCSWLEESKPHTTTRWW